MLFLSFMCSVRCLQLLSSVVACLWVSVTEKLPYLAEIRWLILTPFCLEKFWSCFCNMVLGISCEAPFDHYGRIKLNALASIALYTSEFMLRLVTVPSGSQTFPCYNIAFIVFEDHMICFGSLPVFLILHMFLFPSFWYKFVSDSSKGCFFVRTVSALLDILAKSNVTFLFLSAVVNALCPFMKKTLDCEL